MVDIEGERGYSGPHRAGIELIEDWWVGFVFDLLGCFASERTLAGCQAALPAAVRSYADWRAKHGEPLVGTGAEVEVDEIIRCWPSAPDYEVNAFFAADRPPLDASEVALATRLLDLTRADLLASVDGLSSEDLERPVEAGWSIRDILLHVGSAEWWYFDRLGLSMPREAVPDEPFGRLEAVRAHTLRTLPDLIGSDQLTCRQYEHWSPRKVVRRALWHERNHTSHILQFRSRLHGEEA